MAYSITINGVDRTADVQASTITIEDVLNDEQNLCAFTLIDLSGNGIPENDQEIIITLASSVKLFAGYIVNVTFKSKKESGAIEVAIECQDYSRLLDRNLVHRTYEDMTDKAIIEDIVSIYCAGFGITTVNVAVGATISQKSFNYIQPSQAIRQIAELT